MEAFLTCVKPNILLDTGQQQGSTPALLQQHIEPNPSYTATSMQHYTTHM
jgi:hypothetical protein